MVLVITQDKLLKYCIRRPILCMKFSHICIPNNISKLAFGTINRYVITFYILEGVVVLKGNVVLDTVFD